MAELDKLKLLLGIPAGRTDEDDLLSSLLLDAKAYAAGFCHVSGDDARLAGVIIRMAAEDWGKSTALGVSRRSVSGLSETYHGSYSERVMSELRSLRHVRAVGGAV